MLQLSDDNKHVLESTDKAIQYVPSNMLEKQRRHLT